MALYLVPIMVIHSFMGQFSSSGFISAFRVSPFFKGNISISFSSIVLDIIYFSRHWLYESGTKSGESVVL